MKNFWAKQAKPEEQGSFCDTQSEYHYDQLGRDETLNTVARYEEHNSGHVFTTDDEDPRDLPPDTKFNTTLFDVDGVGYEHRAKHGPGN